MNLMYAQVKVAEVAKAYCADFWRTRKGILYSQANPFLAFSSEVTVFKFLNEYVANLERQKAAASGKSYTNLGLTKDRFEEADELAREIVDYLKKRKMAISVKKSGPPVEDFGTIMVCQENERVMQAGLRKLAVDQQIALMQKSLKLRFKYFAEYLIHQSIKYGYNAKPITIRSLQECEFMGNGVSRDVELLLNNPGDEFIYEGDLLEALQKCGYAVILNNDEVEKYPDEAIPQYGFAGLEELKKGKLVLSAKKLNELREILDIQRNHSLVQKLVKENTPKELNNSPEYLLATKRLKNAKKQRAVIEDEFNNEYQKLLERFSPQRTAASNSVKLEAQNVRKVKAKIRKNIQTELRKVVTNRPGMNL